LIIAAVVVAISKCRSEKVLDKLQALTREYLLSFGRGPSGGRLSNGSLSLCVSTYWIMTRA
jgi:hypothetical protein